jgi:DNA end-binding protein Ku
MRSLWKGSLVVGKLVIPAALHKACEHEDPSFRSLHRDCGSPVEQVRRCPQCQVEIGGGYEETVRGFEVAEGQFVTIENQKLEEALGGKVLDLDRFVATDSVAPILGSTTYWLAPANDAYARLAYVTLRNGLEDTGLAGLGRLAFYTKERVACVRPNPTGLLTLQTLYVGSEVRDFRGLTGPLADIEPGESELKLMVQALEQRTRAFQHGRLAKLYPRRIPELVRTLVAGGQTHAVTSPPATVDLSEALRQSIRRPRRRAKSRV